MSQTFRKSKTENHIQKLRIRKRVCAKCRCEKLPYSVEEISDTK